MIDLLFLSIAIGVAVSLLFSEALGRAAGGLIVPGYLAFHLTQPLNILLTLAVAAATYALVKWSSTVLIIYGKRRTAAMILAGFALGGLARLGLAHLIPAETHAGLAVIGFIIPGLIAIWFDRQGLLDTCSAMFTAAVVTRVVLILVAASQLQLWELEHLPTTYEPATQLTAYTAATDISPAPELDP